MQGTIILRGQTPLASGSTQLIYQHPQEERQLIKVRQLENLEKRYRKKLGGIVGYQRRYGLYTTWMRELKHYHAIRLRISPHPLFLQNYYGLVDTDLGLGMVVGKVTDRSGALAPTIGQVVRKNGLDPLLLQKVEDLRQQVNALRISTNDVSPNNIVRGWNETAGEHLVLIEGIGVNTFIPVASFSNFLNVRSNNRHFAKAVRLLRKIDARSKAVSNG